MLPDMPEDAKPTEHDLIQQLRGANGAPSETELQALRRLYRDGEGSWNKTDLLRWRALGWITERSIELTPDGLALIGEWTRERACDALLVAMRACEYCRGDDELPGDDRLDQCLVNHLLPPVSKHKPEPPAAPMLPDPGPDLSPSLAVRPRTPEEARAARASLRRLADALLRHGNPALRACGRMAWLLSVLPLSTAEEVGDALEFAARVLSLVSDPDLWRGVTISEETLVRQAVLDVLSDLGFLVDDMRAELESGVTDRRRSVTPPTSMTQLEREWDVVPVEQVELLFERARAITDDALLSGGRLVALRAVVRLIEERRTGAASSPA